MKEKFKIEGMTCSACVAHVDKAVRKIPGINDVNVNLLTNSMEVIYDDKSVNNQMIIEAVTASGYKAFVNQSNNIVRHANVLWRRFIYSLCFLIPLLYVSMGHMIGLPLPFFLEGTTYALYFAIVELVLTLPIIIINFGYFTRGLKNLFKGRPNMDTLIAIGALASVCYGIFAIIRISQGMINDDLNLIDQYRHELYFESAGTILTLVTLGKWLEGKSKKKTLEQTESLAALVPQTALVLKNDEVIETPIDDVKIGDIIVVKPGMAIPVDGIIVEGNTSINQANITGESLPVYKTIDDEVISSTINGGGAIKFKATKVGLDTTIATMVRLVEEAGNSKAPIARLADKISGYFVPAVIAIALVSFAIWWITTGNFEFAMSIGITVLVISCPCALGLATPVAIMVGTGMGATHGLLIKEATSLENAHKIKTIVLDKTGTITMGHPTVTDIVAFNNYQENTILAIAAGLEEKSEHPLAGGVIEEARKRGIKNDEISDFMSHPGLGVEGKVAEEHYFIGNLVFLQNQNVHFLDEQKLVQKYVNEGKTPLYLANQTQILGVIFLKDQVKPTSAKAVANLRHLGIDVTMLTGDNYATAMAIAKEVGIDNVIAEVLPSDKMKEIENLKKNGLVAMVGDGVNDALALISSDVGIAIGAGSDLAIDAADIILVRNDLNDVVDVIRLSKKTINNIKLSLFWAFFYNTIGVILATGILYPSLGIRLNPMIASFAMSLSSVCVVLNALRLRLFKTTKKVINQKEGANMEVILKVDGMSCMHCQKRVLEALQKVENVEEVNVDLATKQATIKSSKPLNSKELVDAVVEAGYEAEISSNK